MANYKFTSDIVEDVLFRANEKIDGTSDFDAQALVYVNRAYRSLILGGLEFEIPKNTDWWWLRTRSSFVLLPSIKAGTVSVTNNSTAITFTTGPTPSVKDYYFKTDSHKDVFKISAHTAASMSATLDGAYTGDTKTGESFRLMKFEYSLPSDAIKIVSPMHGFLNGHNEIHHMALHQMELRWPLENIQSGVPEKFAMFDETTVRFNTFGSDDGDLNRINFDYMKRPNDLIDSASDEPLVPIHYRHIIADMALYYLLLDKDEQKALEAFRQAQRGISAMLIENEQRLAFSGRIGETEYRQRDTHRDGVLRTETGVIIG